MDKLKGIKLDWLLKGSLKEKELTTMIPFQPCPQKIH